MNKLKNKIDFNLVKVKVKHLSVIKHVKVVIQFHMKKTNTSVNLHTELAVTKLKFKLKS
jgi:hypothetical protein